MIISAENLPAIASVLYAKEYSVLPIKSFHNGSFGDCLMAFGQADRATLREDATFLSRKFGADGAVVKFAGDTFAVGLRPDGTQRQLDLHMYCTDHDKVAYIHEGVSFSFSERPVYSSPKAARDLSAGMVVEYFSNDRWNKRVVSDPAGEWERMYGLLAKHDKLRVLGIGV